MNYLELRALFSQTPKPTEVRGDSFRIDMTQEKLEALIESKPESLIADDFSGYVGTCVVGEAEDYRYLLPTILRIWEESLNEHEAWFPSYLNYDLARDSILESYLDDELRAGVTSFMHRAISKRVAAEHSLRVEGSSTSHNWCRHLNSFGVVSPELPKLWNEVWNVQTAGHACAVLQYSSCLAFTANRNPIFAPYSCHLGGGELELWGYESEGFDECWLPPNVAFLRETLSVQYLLERLAEIASLYPGTKLQRMSERIRTQIKLESDRVAGRCGALALALERPSGVDLLDWKTLGVE